MSGDGSSPRRRAASEPSEPLPEQQGIAPGIVVGMLQHAGLIPWSHLNGLKISLEWRNAE